LPHAFRAFMQGLIDYAGLFPPARLGMGEALREYARLGNEPESWMLGRFIVPATRLGALEAELPALDATGARALRLSVIVDAGSGQDLPDRLAGEAAALRDFVARRADRVAIEAIESRLPRSVAAEADPAAVRRHVGMLRSAIADAGFPEIPFYLEAGGAAILDVAAIEGIAEARGRDGARGAGFKLRCGGLQPADFPVAERIAGAIGACAALAVPMKFTAGLHHPVRRRVDPPGVVQHGFLNVFGAGGLAASRSLEGVRILDCLLDEDPASFRFDDFRFAWRGLGADAREVEAARLGLVTGYGSCSFDEPRDGLRALGMLV
jgi:hypothetical protein